MGIEATAGDGYGINELHQAVLDGDVIAMSNLLSGGVDANPRDWSGETPLHYAARAFNNRNEMVRLLLHHGANILAKNARGRSCLDTAYRHNRLETRDIMLTSLENEKNITETTRNPKGQTQLHLAVMATLANVHPNIPHIRSLLNSVLISVNDRDNQGKTPLHYATKHFMSKEGRMAIVDILLKYGANALAKDHQRITPLNNAVSHDNAPIIATLLLKSLGFYKGENTCENAEVAIAGGKNRTISVFVKSNGNFESYIPSHRGTDGAGNDRLQTTVESALYPGTQDTVMELKWDHEEGGIVSGYFVMPRSKGITLDNNVPCDYRIWDNIVEW